MAGENARNDSWYLVDLPVEGIKQEGPTCGLVALHMACFNLFHDRKEVGKIPEERAHRCSHSECISLSNGAGRPTVKDLLGKHSCQILSCWWKLRHNLMTFARRSGTRARLYQAWRGVFCLCMYVIVYVGDVE